MISFAPNRSGKQRIALVRRVPRNHRARRRRARAARKRVRPASRRRRKKRRTLTNKLHSPIITPAQMRTAEEAAFARGITAEALMEQAGEGIARAVVRFFP